MRPSIPIILLLLLVTAIFASTPINIHLSYHSGYDSNVMRFSQKEIQSAANDRSMMGGAGTFDSYVSRINTRLQKTLFVLGKKEIVKESDRKSLTKEIRLLKLKNLKYLLAI